MKRNTYHLSAALALLLALAACTQDELADDNRLPAGEYPVVIRATGLSVEATPQAAPSTRATVDGDWQGVTSVALRLDGAVKEYTVTASDADGYRSATLSRTDDPFYWTSRNDITVSAWWPYAETLPAVKVAEDQSTLAAFQGSDFISAENQTVTFSDPKLTFTHRTARVTVALTDCPEESMNVRLTGLSTENENPAVITPYNQGGDTYTALVAPQSVATGTAFITCTFTSGKSFVYKMKKNAEWKAGEEYTYTVSLAAAEDPGYTIEGDGSYTVNNEKGLKNIAELVNGGETDIDITLDTDLTLTGEWTPIGTYDNPYTGTFNGKDKTITELKITGSNDYAGLFGCIGSGGKVMNVTLENVQITSDNSSGYAGGVAGWSYGTIENCSVSGSVSGTVFAGGVVGSQVGGPITGCNSSATVKDVKLTKASVTGGVYVGGVAGQNDGTVENCSVDGTVTGTEYDTGGIVGINYGKISGCKAEGTVTGSVNVGGIAGDGAFNPDTGTGSTIEGCHSTAAVSGSSTVGGVVGNLGNGCSLMACYSTGDVTATITSGYANAGGVVGANSRGTVTGCYHATGTVSGQNNVGGIVGFNSSGTFTACY